MEKCKEATTPMSTSCYMDVDLAGTVVDQTKYKGLIGSLLYLTASRSDIMFVVCLCARFQSSPKESYLKVSKRILKYLMGKTFVGLWMKHTSGTCHLLGSSLISWHNKKQACVTLSIAEPEYIADGSCCAQILWIKQ
ncbi:uncharacterized mitochondrial protein AtMg00810-like [Phaseolus vulgaris]|uniref:uncharacterized mitochondrial protein AtMg00810-like n=1 Tax=Phaseolus vulgaris TaxID=3885 RepID=UPI0035CC0AE3